jgi:hypothetical protein
MVKPLENNEGVRVQGPATPLLDGLGILSLEKN